MQRRLGALKRLAALYGAVEDARSAELQRTITALREAENAIDLQHELLRDLNVAGRAALAEEDRIGRAVAETNAEVAGWSCERLQVIRGDRRAARLAAEARYLASRVESEQMKRLRDDLGGQLGILEGRRAQAAADERFLARKCWSEPQQARR